MRARWSWLLFSLVAVVVIGVVWVGMVRHHRSALDQVDREIAARRYGAARLRLMGLSTRWMGRDEVDYRLGLCEGYLGHDEAALAAWGRLPSRSPFAEAAALNSAAVEMNRGRFASAETILEGAAPSRPPGRHGWAAPGPALLGSRANLREASGDRVELANRQPAHLAQTRGAARIAA